MTGIWLLFLDLVTMLMLLAWMWATYIAIMVYARKRGSMRLAEFSVSYSATPSPNQ